MSRWGKNIVVPLDSLLKEKENNNRPTVARSVGTVGKWGKMGFTSTRTYALSALPAAVAAVAAAAAAAAASSPTLSPASAGLDDEMSPTVPEPPKPKKFFKSRNAAPPEVIAQMIQQIPRASTSPIRDSSSAGSFGGVTPMHGGRDPIKMKIPKTNSAERKKKSPKKTAAAAAKAAKAASDEDGGANTDVISTPEAKPKKKKEEKKLKPEAPPSRIISRARKAVNYCEDDEDDRAPTPLKDIIMPKNKQVSKAEEPPPAPPVEEPVLPPPAVPVAAAPVAVAPPVVSNVATTPAAPVQIAPKTPEHPPIVLRISKGTSRLVSTDSEEQPTSSPQHETVTKTVSEPLKSSRHTSIEEASGNVTGLPILPTTPKIIVKPPKPPSPSPPPPPPAIVASDTPAYDDEPPEINYCTVKISPDKPPKERLKLIIKTDVIRNAIAAAAAAEKAKAAAAAERAAAAAAAAATEKPEKEKKQKNKKHKHPKHVAVEQLTPSVNAVEFKTPSPHLALGGGINSQQSVSASNDIPQHYSRTIISPPALSERDFDSQSSVLGSISSKGNSTPQTLAQVVQEESCVIHSRGSSVITSDLETSQHSSLVAPPSDELESRLESMMEGGLDGEDVQEAAQKVPPIVEEPLQEDILAVLRGDETLTDAPAATINGEAEIDKAAEVEDEVAALEVENVPTRRVTRGRRAVATKSSYAEAEISPVKAQPATRRGRKAATAPVPEEPPTPKRTTRRGAVATKKVDEPAESTPMEVDSDPTSSTEVTPTKSEKESTSSSTKASPQVTPSPPSAPAPRQRGRPRANNNNLSNNNNINKIVADLSAKAGAAEAEAAKVIVTPAVAVSQVATPNNTRSYGRKRKNQQVTQVLQPSIDDREHSPPPAKVSSLDAVAPANTTTTPTVDLLSSQELGHENNSIISNQTPTMEFESNSDSNMIAAHMENSNMEGNVSPPRRDYKIKDKFKRTLMLDHQAAQAFNCNAAAGSPSPNNLSAEGPTTTGAASEEVDQRASVKLVISKKKGSIFKSRALVPDQAEQAAAKRSHLYKHRWDAEANGMINADGSVPTETIKSDSNSKATMRTAADAIFDDFSEDLSGGATSRDSSPSLAKLSRVIKPNPQSNNNAYDLSADMDGGQGECITSIKVDRKAKEYYTVVRNVKTAHQIQEIGEYQEMDDDVEYILDALQPHNPTPTRCLSALQLATKCMTPTFRMHVRAHGVVTKFFKALSDANTDLSLGLCTTAIMYILSQEGLNMDLDRDSLELMMNLLESEGVAAEPSDHANYERNKQKVRELCEEIKAQGKATHLNVDTITVGTLAMETLLSLTSKRAGEWFKEELRELGGLEHIIKTVSDCSRLVINIGTDNNPINWTQSVLDNMKTVERCMRVLENVTQMNEENQKYMLTYARGSAVNTLCELYRLCDRELMLYPTADFTSKENPGVVIRELLIPLMKVLINLTHTFNPTSSLGAEMLGKRADVIETSFHILLQVPNYIPDRCIFELNILVLLLLINLTMYTAANRSLIMKTYAPPEFGSRYNEQQLKVTAVQAVMEYFYKCEELARFVEKNTDAILDCSDKNKKKQEEVDETVNNLLQKAGHHMEHTMKGSYAGILIGHLITDSDEYEMIVRNHLRGNGFKEIVSVLEKYYTFMNLTASSESSVVAHIKSTKKLIDYFKKRDLVYEMNDTNDCALPLNAATTVTTTTTSSKRSSPNLSPTPTATATRGAQRVYKTYSQR